jgi:tetratricopeptide (TPR) repeat protein
MAQEALLPHSYCGMERCVTSGELSEAIREILQAKGPLKAREIARFLSPRYPNIARRDVNKILYNNLEANEFIRSSDYTWHLYHQEINIKEIKHELVSTQNNKISAISLVSETPNPPKSSAYGKIQRSLILKSGKEAFTQSKLDSVSTELQYPNRKTEENLLKSGYYCFNMGKYREARKCFEEAKQLNPQSAEIFHMLGRCAVELSRLNEARKLFQNAIALDQRNAEVHYHLGLIHVLEKQYPKAIICFTDALRINSKYVEALRGRAEAKAEISDYQEALTDINKAIDTKPDYADGYYYRGLIYSEMLRYHDAIRDFNRALLLNPLIHSVYLDKGLALAEIDKEKEAVIALNEYIKRADSTVEVEAIAFAQKQLYEITGIETL